MLRVSLRFLIHVATIVVCLAIIALSVLHSTSSTRASTTRPAHPLVSCSGASCNGQDPNATGCNDQYAATLASKTLVDEQSNSNIGSIALVVSPTCGTEFGIWTPYSPGWWIVTIAIERCTSRSDFGMLGACTAENIDESYTIDVNSAPSTTDTIFTPMVFTSAYSPGNGDETASADILLLNAQQMYLGDTEFY